MTVFGPLESCLYAFDIETDTSGKQSRSGLNPQITPIKSVAVVGPNNFELYLSGDDENEMLRELDDCLSAAPPGYLATYNGAVFDIPFLLTRSRYQQTERHRRNPISGLEVKYDPSIVIKYEKAEGHPGGYRAAWGNLVHVDLWPYGKMVAENKGLVDSRGKPTSSLKPVNKSLGIPMINVDRQKIHLLSPEELYDYTMSDTRGTRKLGLLVGEEIEMWSDLKFLQDLALETTGRARLFEPGFSLEL